MCGGLALRRRPCALLPPQASSGGCSGTWLTTASGPAASRAATDRDDDVLQALYACVMRRARWLIDDADSFIRVATMVQASTRLCAHSAPRPRASALRHAPISSPSPTLCVQQSRNGTPTNMKQPSTKKAKTSSGPAPAPSAARPQRLQPSQGFVVCPVCQQSTAAATIDMHVEQCLLRPRPAQRPDAPPHPAPPPPSAAAAAAPQHDTRQQQQQLVLSPPPESAVRSAPAAPATAPATASGAAQHERHQEPQQQRQEPQQEQLQPQAPQQQQEERHEQGRHERPHQPPPQAPLAASTPPASSYSPHAAASPSAPPRLPPAPNALHALMQASHQQAAQHLDNKRGFHGTLAPPPPPHLAAPPTPPEALAQIPSTPPADMRVVAHEQLPGQYLLVSTFAPRTALLLLSLQCSARGEAPPWAIGEQVAARGGPWRRSLSQRRRGRISRDAARRLLPARARVRGRICVPRLRVRLCCTGQLPAPARGAAAGAPLRRGPARRLVVQQLLRLLQVRGRRACALLGFVLLMESVGQNRSAARNGIVTPSPGVWRHALRRTWAAALLRLSRALPCAARGAGSHVCACVRMCVPQGPQLGRARGLQGQRGVARHRAHAGAAAGAGRAHAPGAPGEATLRRPLGLRKWWAWVHWCGRWQFTALGAGSWQPGSKNVRQPPQTGAGEASACRQR